MSWTRLTFLAGLTVVATTLPAAARGPVRPARSPETSREDPGTRSPERGKTSASWQAPFKADVWDASVSRTSVGTGSTPPAQVCAVPDPPGVSGEAREAVPVRPEPLGPGPWIESCYPHGPPSVR